MQKTTSRQFDQSTLAILHRAGRVWRGVIARLPAKGTGRPQLVAHREFSAAESSRLASWVDQQNAGQIAVVLHASSVICRTCSLPDAPADQLGPALRLQAESHLFGIAPPHRMGMAILEQAPGETTRAGIVLAWPEHRPETGEPDGLYRPPISAEQLAGRIITYAPDVASLAALLDGQRPAQPLAWVDREDGSLALAVTHANGAVFRGLREDTSDPAQWEASAGRVLAETGLSVGHTASFIESLVSAMREKLAQIGEGDSRLIAPAEVYESAKQRLDGAPNDEHWWSAYGIAAGVALARSSELAPLTELRESVPVKHASLLDRTMIALSSRTAAVSAVAACVAVLMFGPLVFNGLRLAILKMKYPEAELREKIADVRTINNQVVMYRELDRTSWSMTKVLSDITSNTPQGIELEHIRISPQRTFSVTGTVIPHGGMSATELVAVMRQNLDDCGIFRDTALTWRDPDPYGHYQFTLSAYLAQPFRVHDYPEDLDFAQKTLAERMWGPRAAPGGGSDVELVTGLVEEVITRTDSAPAAEASGRDDEASAGALPVKVAVDDVEKEASDRDRSSSRPSRIGGIRTPSRDAAMDRAGASSITERDSAPSAEADAPPPLTQEQIAGMNESEVMSMLTRVAQARQRAQARQDQELIDRLKQEFEWLMERRRSLR